MEFTPKPYTSGFRPSSALGAAVAPIPLSVAAPAQAAAPEWQPPKLAKRPQHLLLAQIAPDKGKEEASGPSVPYSVLVAVVLGGIAVGLLTHKYRDDAFGGIAFGAAASVTGVGLTLLLVELVR